MVDESSEKHPPQPVPRPEDHIGLARKVAHKFRWAIGPGLQFKDLVQAGMEGVLRACEDFDRYRGTKFSTYAIWWVQNSVGRLVSQQRNTVRVPESRQAKDRAMGRRPAVSMESLDREMPNQWSTQGRTMLETLPDESCGEQHGLDITIGEERVTLSRALVSTLGPREQRVIKGRFWEDLTLREIGEELGLSRERVRQLQKSALETMHRHAVRLEGREE